MKLFYFFKTVLFLSTLLCFTACDKLDELENIDGTDANPEFALPLINTRLALTDLLENFDALSFIEIDEDGLIHLKYQGDLVSKTSEDIFESVNAAIPPVIPVTAPRMALPFTSPDGVEIDRIIFKTGTIQYGFLSEHEETVRVQVTIPTLTKDGVPFSRGHLVPYLGTTPALPLPSPEPFDLAGYELATDNDSIFIEYQALLENGETDTLTNFIIAVSGVEFAYAEGFLGKQVYDSSSDTIEIDFFENWKRGDVFFEDPQITINIDNAFGLPTRSLVNVFDIITATGDTLPLQSSLIENGVDFNYPALTEVGAIRRSSYTFTTENSNIAEVLGSNPVALIYDVDALTNPDSITGIRGFITDESFFAVTVDVDLPLFGTAIGFGVTDTFEVDFSSFENFNGVEFKIVTDNELGLEVDLQAYFANANGVVLDSLVDDRSQKLIQAAPADNNGNVTETNSTTTFIDYPIARFDKLKNAKFIYLSTSFSTTDAGSTAVKVLEQQGIDIRMGVKTKL